ncbi:hypothetical protein BC940DRAFT_366729 [Gongronella butleri]|nr:hypothetical protein BC940DRAFT_366729 [Gongronella butleri]
MGDRHRHPNKRPRIDDDSMESFPDSFSMLHGQGFPPPINLEPIDRDADVKSMMDNLRGSRALLSASVKTLSGTVSTLQAAMPNLPRLIAATKLTRTHELMTEQDIADARVAVAREGQPQLDLLLDRASELINHLGATVRGMEQKVEIQDKVLQNQKHAQMLHQQVQTSMTKEDQLKIQEMQKRVKRYQLRQETLQRDSTDYDLKIMDLESELASLDQQMETLAKPTAAASPSARRDTTQQQRDEEHLTQELEALTKQLQEKQAAHAARAARAAAAAAKAANDTMDVDHPVLTADEGLTQLHAIQRLLTHLQSASAGDAQSLLTVGEVQKYLQAIERDQVRFAHPLRAEEAADRNTKLLKTYCRTLLTKNKAGFVAERLIDALFTKDGYVAMSRDQLMQTMPSSRQKDIAQAIFDRYSFFSKLK